MFNFNVETIVLVLLAQIGLDLESRRQYLFLHLIDLRKLAVLPCFTLLGKVSVTPFFKKLRRTTPCRLRRTKMRPSIP